MVYWHRNAVLHNEKNSTNASNKAQSAKRIRFEYVFVVSLNRWFHWCYVFSDYLLDRLQYPGKPDFRFIL